jgi:hypothetical protein
VKLGAYNGLHLAIWTQGRSLPTRAILIGDLDQCCSSKPRGREPRTFLARRRNVVCRRARDALCLHAGPPLAAKTCVDRRHGDGMLASVIDLSYEDSALRCQTPPG